MNRVCVQGKRELSTKRKAMVEIWEVLKFYTEVSESASKLYVKRLICELRQSEGLTLETSAFKLFSVANLR